MTLTRRTAGLLVAAGLWPLLIFPNFLRVTWRDDRSFDAGPTAFLLVHLALSLVSMAFGALLLTLGVRAWRAGRTPTAPVPERDRALPQR